MTTPEEAREWIATHPDEVAEAIAHIQKMAPPLALINFWFVAWWGISLDAWAQMIAQDKMRFLEEELKENSWTS